MKERLIVLFCVLILLELPAMPLCRAAGAGVELALSSDSSSVPAWGSCNLTARLTQDGAPLSNVDITWEVSGGVTESNHSTTDSSGIASVPLTAVVSAAHGSSGTVEAGASATVGGIGYSAMTNITIDPKPVQWTGQVSYRANAGELYPGETLYMEVGIDQPEGTPWNYIANFTVEADIVDSTNTTVNTVVLGKGLSLTEGMEWSSGDQALFQVPQNPPTLNYCWTFYILTPHGTYTYYQPDHMIPLKILLAGKDGWTFLIYLDGDNNLDSWTDKYFNRLELEAPTNEFTVLIQWDLPGRATTRWKLTYDNDPTEVRSQLIDTLSNVDSGNWQTALHFMEWGASYAPAGHYLLSMWDHGDSYLGSCSDYSSGTNIPDQWLAYAMEQFAMEHRKVDVLVLDVCLQSSLEAAYQFMNVAGFLVGCEIPLGTDIFTPIALAGLKSYYPGNPSPLLVVKEILEGYRLNYSDLEPITATDLAAAHTAIVNLDALGKSLLKKWTVVKKWMLDSRSCCDQVEGPLANLHFLVDAKGFFQALGQDMEANQAELGMQISALDKFLASVDAMAVDRVASGTYTGYHIFLPPNAADYKGTRDDYLRGGLPETNGWVQVLDRLFLPVKPSQPGVQTVYPAYPGYLYYPVDSPNLFRSDTNGDGNYEAVSVDIACNQTGNSRPVTVIVDLIAYNGSKASRILGLADRKVFAVDAGTRSNQNITLTSPVEDRADVALTILTDKGIPLEEFHLGSLQMNASDRAGQPPQLNITASSTSVTEGQMVDFTAVATGRQGANLTIWWDFDDQDGVGIDATGASASTIYRGAWNRTVTCIATDGTNLAVQTLEIAVGPDLANHQPVANLTALFLDTNHPLKVRLNASRTYDPDGEPVEYMFDFGDENSTVWASDAVVEHEYATPGNYDCVVMVRDHTAYNGSFATVTVRPGTTPISLPPVAVLKIPAAKVRTGKAVTADVSGSSDPAGSPLLFHIAWGDGNVTDWANSTNTTHIYAKAGNYTIELTVRNKWDLAAVAISTVSVVPKPKAAKGAFIPGPTIALAVVALALAVGLTRARKRK